MTDFEKTKSTMLQDLWLPIIRIGGNKFYPRLRTNKRMKLFTLTSDTNFEEIEELVKERLTEREQIIAWNYSHLKIIRLETEIGPAVVLGTTRFEDTISAKSSVLKKHFPFDILILDFSSQRLLDEDGRIEKEILSVENCIDSQSAKSQFVLIYTTIFNSKIIDLKQIQENSNHVRVKDWNGLDISQNPKEIKDNLQKIVVIEDILTQIFKKHSFDNMHRTKTIKLSERKTIYSIAFVLSRVKL